MGDGNVVFLEGGGLIVSEAALDEERIFCAVVPRCTYEDINKCESESARLD